MSASDTLHSVGGPSISEILERLAPGTPMRYALERIIQQGKGGLVVLGDNPRVQAASSGGFTLMECSFTPARLAELSKMDGGVVLDDSWDVIKAANVHFIPDGSIATDETGARHRTAERLARETRAPVVAVSEGRRVATLFYGDRKIELATPTEMAAHVNQELQSLERLKSRLEEAEMRLSRLEVTGLATYRAVVTVIYRAELVQRLGTVIRDRTRTLGDDGRIATLQLNDLLSGVAHTEEMVLTDYLKPLRPGSVERALESLSELSASELEDASRLAKELGFTDLDDPADARGHRLLSKVARLPDSVREEIVRHFGSVTRLLGASESQLIDVEGVGETRARQLMTFFHRLEATAHEWEPVLD
ncbi:MAG TPA: DNA integrity scanning diadenylate cyclase DisA [Acidimicrobiia bacterium]|nr:DNA integrity scanning diadenylate cyclase DisA [Acidimicrobiia bacterium]